MRSRHLLVVSQSTSDGLGKFFKWTPFTIQLSQDCETAGPAPGWLIIVPGKSPKSPVKTQWPIMTCSDTAGSPPIRKY